MRAPTLSSGFIIVRKNPVRVLVLRAYQNWDFPKGAVEAGETPLTAALRETEEETTLRGLRLSWGEAFHETLPYSSPKKIARYYLAEIPEEKADSISLPVNPEIGKPEHDEFRWVSFEEARTLLPSRLQTTLKWAEEKLFDASRLR